MAHTRSMASSVEAATGVATVTVFGFGGVGRRKTATTIQSCRRKTVWVLHGCTSAIDAQWTQTERIALEFVTCAFLPLLVRLEAKSGNVEQST